DATTRNRTFTVDVVAGMVVIYASVWVAFSASNREIAARRRFCIRIKSEARTSKLLNEGIDALGSVGVHRNSPLSAGEQTAENDQIRRSVPRQVSPGRRCMLRPSQDPSGRTEVDCDEPIR